MLQFNLQLLLGRKLFFEAVEVHHTAMEYLFLQNKIH